jgi:hypothetical protein
MKCETGWCEGERAEFIDPMDNKVCTLCMLTMIEDDGDLCPEDFEPIEEE